MLTLIAVAVFLLFCPTAIDAVTPPPTDPQLPFGDINVVVLTDIHSWLASHRRQEPHMDADLGNILSFWERLKAHCDAHDMDLFFVNNGDFVHGTGLSQMPGNPSYLIPLLEKVPYDAVNCGNHELYGDANVAYMTRPGGYVDWWGDRYVTSNVGMLGNDDHFVPLGGKNYKLLKGRHSTLLTFGFLYDMHDASGMVEILRVEDVVQQAWFKKALSDETYDALLILAHMDLVDPLVEIIRKAIRQHIGDAKPIMFITGHTHYRGVQQLEDMSMTFEAGKYLDTVGFVSFPRVESAVGKNASSLFQNVFLDTNRKFLFKDTLGYEKLEDGETENGQALSEFIVDTRTKLGLEEEIGCAPKSYFVERHIEDDDSLWKLFRDEVVPKVFGSRKTDEQRQDDLPISMMLSKGSWRYDIFDTTELIADDIMVVAPFNDTVVYMGSFTGSVILQVNETINKRESKYGTWRQMLPDYILIGDVINGDPSSKYHLYSHDFDAKGIEEVLKEILPNESVVVKETEYRSTLIWMAFVKEFWRCDGVLGRLPDWFPTSKKNSANGQSHNNAYVSWALIAVIIISSAACFGVAVKRWCEYQTIAPEEARAFDGKAGIMEDDETTIEEHEIL